MLVIDFKYPRLLKFFEDISAIPRATFHEEKAADYISAFAESRGLEYYRDEANNVFVTLCASEGREGEDAVLLQGHTDMVCEKNEGIEHDFLSDGLELYIDGELLRACGTTLGADNGVAVAVMLYILDGALTSHPKIECLFTSSEEVGLIGAKSFDYRRVTAKHMINMDSADEKQIIAGCAGGQRTTLVMSPAYISTVRKEAVKINICGLFGGHSGEDIDKGRANANKLLGRALSALAENNEFNLCSLFGGSKDNAIPREASALLVTDCAEKIIADCRGLEAIISSELSSDDSGFSLTAEKAEVPDEMLDLSSTKKAVFLLACVPNGVFEYNRSIPSLVEFSRNLGVVSTQNGRIEFVFAARSAMRSRIEQSNTELAAFADILGMTVEMGEGYPGWDYAPMSEIRDRYARAYRELYSEDVEVTLIHAGLECGIIKERLPELDIISCGPVVANLHSPDEYLSLPSFERFYAVIEKVFT